MFISNKGKTIILIFFGICFCIALTYAWQRLSEINIDYEDNGETIFVSPWQHLNVKLPISRPNYFDAEYDFDILKLTHRFYKTRYPVLRNSIPVDHMAGFDTFIFSPQNKGTAGIEIYTRPEYSEGIKHSVLKVIVVVR